MKLRDQVAQALAPLVGLPLRDTGRALNMQMFDFGKPCKYHNYKGQEIEGWGYALHIQCPWRVIGPDGIVVGDRDSCYPADESAEWEGFDPDEGKPSHLEAGIFPWMEKYADEPLTVERVEADSVGGFQLFLTEGFVLEAFPSDSLKGEYSEHWRIFRPAQDNSHFVMTGHGVEE